MKKIMISAALAAMVAVPAVANTSINFGTGGETGVYYQVGQNICKLVDRANINVKCTAPSTGGSIANINAINAGDLQFGVAQSDWQYHAYNGTSRFAETGKVEKLRAVFSMHPEPFSIMARKDANIKSFDDLKGKRVNLGNPSSGTRGTMDELLNELGWTKSDFKLALELKPSEMAQSLCNNDIDAYAYSIGHPNGSFSEAATTCDSTIVTLMEGETQKAVEKLIAENAFYSPAAIPANLYRGSEQDAHTFGVGATVVASADVPEDVVYNMVKVVFENIDRLKRSHPAFANLNPENMVVDFLSAPLHPGAEKYYREVGLIK